MLKGFEDQSHARLYAKFRPTYPQEVADKVMKYARKNKEDGKLIHLVDVGCGNGQSTESFSPYFEKITAVDVSESQIVEAKKRGVQSNIEYVAAPAEELPVEDNSVDVICSGQAIHWADFPKFWEECHRVMKPDGSVVLYGYDMPNVQPKGSVPSQLSHDEVKKRARMLTVSLNDQCVFHPRINHVINLYVEIFDLIPSEEKCRDDTLMIQRHWTLEDLGNYLTTWSGYQTYLRERDAGDESPDILRNYLNNLKKLLGQETARDEEISLLVTWDIFMLFSKRPTPQS